MRGLPSNPHVLVAVACYVASLFFPAFYVNDNFGPQSSFGVLLFGWLASLVLNPGWFANPAFLLAVVLTARPRKAAVLAGIALVLALSFLVYRHVPVHEPSSAATVTAYGWGYALWVMSMAILFGGHLAIVRGADDFRVPLSGTLSGGVMLAAYMFYLMSGAGGLRANSEARDRAFAARCTNTGVHVVRRARDARSVVLSPDWSWTIGQWSDWSSEKKQRQQGSIMRRDLLRDGRLEFVEASTRDQPNAYLRFEHVDSQGVAVEELQGAYAVTVETKDDFRLDLEEEVILIHDRRDGSVLAKASYVIDRQTRRYCGAPGFSTQAMVMDVLGLQQR